MKTSVVIPVRNGARTIEATLETVLSQSVPPDEILILDDGSTDNTASIVRSYREKVRLLQQANRGIAPSRNTLCLEARGDLIAFLDADDLWHPRYLELQRRSFAFCPNAVAYFTGHVNFRGYGNYQWDVDPAWGAPDIELIGPLEFLKRYNAKTGYFASMSYCCVPKKVLTAIGEEPFRVSGVDDSYLCTTLPLYGEVAYASLPLVAYRVTDAANSVNRLKMFGLWVRVFELLEERYEREAGKHLREEFRLAFASKKRQYGKLLMAAGRGSEARRQFWQSMRNSSNPSSMAKSVGLFLSSYMPSPLHPKWPLLYRQ